jgi:hypothetical protein
VIGAKSLATLGLLALGCVAAAMLGVLRPERLLALDPPTLFFVAAFAVVAGTLAFRFWRLGEGSARYFRAGRTRRWAGESHFVGGVRWRVALGENRGEAFDLGPRAQQAVCIALALLLALATMDARSLALLGHFQRGIAAASSAYCPEVEAAEDKSDPNAPGCELIRRAYALGYAKDLGDCGAKARRASAVCTLRQRDEPFFHYAWRLLDKAWRGLRQDTDPEYLRGLKRDFDERVVQLKELGSARRQILSAAPHASHHIWTNLPDPGDGAFKAETCADRYRSLPHRPPSAPGPARASKVFEHAVAELLFESSYEPAAGSCREYHVHWGAPEDACERLAKAPEAFLEQAGAMGDVRATLDRQRLVTQLDSLAAKEPAQKSQRQLDPTAFVSFQCYAEGASPHRLSRTFSLAGTQFSAEDLEVAPSAPDAALFVDRYAAIASTLANGFHYGSLMSEAGLEQGGVDSSVEPAFQGKDFLLSRLYGLANLDIYVGPGWIASRPDLLEVYPYELHLRNYVRVFRRQYQTERGRL